MTRQIGARRALRIVSWTLAVLLILLVAYLAITTLANPDERMHSVHNTAGAVSYLILASAMIALARAPDDVAPMHVLVVGAAVSVAAGLLGRDLLSGGYVAAPIVVAILIALYPARARIARPIRPVWPLLAFAAVAAGPLVAYAMTQGDLQRDALFPEDPHAALHHYSQMTVTALALLGSVAAAGLGGAGWRVVAWIAAAAFVAFGTLSLVLDEHLGAPEPFWCWAAIAAGTGVLVAAELIARRAGRSAAEAA